MPRIPGFSPDRGTVEHEPTREIRVEKKTLVLIVGLPGSGKSTFAAENFPMDAVAGTDRIRQELSNNPSNQLVSDKAFFMVERLVKERLSRGKIIVVDAMNLTENARKRFMDIAKKENATIQAIVMDTSAEESVARDQARARKVGASEIKVRRSQLEIARRTLQSDRAVASVTVVRPGDAVRVELPPEESRERAADQVWRHEADAAAAVIAAGETGYFRREAAEHQTEAFPIEAGSITFYERDQNRDEFLEQNFFPHQIVDATRIASRLGTDVSDPAVADVMASVVRQRASLNLTTIVSVPRGFDGGDVIRQRISEYEKERGVRVPFGDIHSFSSPDEAGRQRVEIVRDAQDDTPLLLVGDVQGCYRSMREFSSRVRDENLSKGKGAVERKIVFVGDMADRGPHDAEAVIYITALVRSGRAMLVKGNHDENLLKVLKGDPAGGSAETQSTAAELVRRLKPESIKKIVEMLEVAPVVAQWKHLVVAHASLPRVPRPGQRLSDAEENLVTHGARSGRFVAGRSEVYPLTQTVAHDPDQLIVGGHTHEDEPVLDFVSGAAILDAGVELQGRLTGLYYPEMQLVSAEEPEVLRMYAFLERRELPTGNDLLEFIEFARQQSLIEVKRGTGEYDGLLIASYSGVTELGNLWDKYPVLRNFRGLIVDRAGTVVARPFEKTHKAGDEIPLEKLDFVPEKIFEKANGSLGVTYFWNGKWRVATKFSFENDGYTKPALEMLAAMNVASLDKKKTHLFEIILPDDSHIVDYEGKRQLILLNSIDAKSGAMDEWKDVEETARNLGATTAADMTPVFKGMTIPQIYQFAQGHGNLKNIEGMMALYRDAEGKQTLVKIKTREYDDKKFVRDRLDWDVIFDAVDPGTMDISPEAREKLLLYNADNLFAKAALDQRIEWMQTEYRRIVSETREFLFGPYTEAQRKFDEFVQDGKSSKEATGLALRATIPALVRLLEERLGADGKAQMGTMMGFLRAFLAGSERPEEALAKHAILKMRGSIEAETKRRGKNGFWIIPEK